VRNLVFKGEMSTAAQEQEDADFAIALSMQAEEEAGANRQEYSPGHTAQDDFPMDYREPSVVGSGRESQLQQTQIQVPGQVKAKSWMSYFSRAQPTPSSSSSSPVGAGQQYLQVDEEAQQSSPVGASDDHMLAWLLQRMEFEIPFETQAEREARELEGEFEGKEYHASKCKNQMLTLSTFLVAVDVILFWVMCAVKGMDANNPMIGPSSLTLVEWGAKDAALIVYRGQWWRLISPIIMHAGIIHLLSNALIQLRVGGYVNLIFGNLNFSVIYLLSGIFGNICSCLFLPEGVSVGASGALLGMLASWCVWIMFRWNKVPEQCHGQRNCQATMVGMCIVITLAMSFASFVDWAAHMGGTLMGGLLGLIFLAKELDNEKTRLYVRVCGVGLSLILFIVSIIALSNLTPSTQFLAFYDYMGVSKAPE